MSAALEQLFAAHEIAAFETPFLLDGTSLRLDFRVQCNNGRFFAFQIDGPSHFSGNFLKQLSRAKQNEALAKTQENDARKNFWCKAHNVPLLRVAFSEAKEHFPEILRTFLAELRNGEFIYKFVGEEYDRVAVKFLAPQPAKVLKGISDQEFERRYSRPAF